MEVEFMNYKCFHMSTFCCWCLTQLLPWLQFTTKYIEYKVATAVANNANRFQARTARFKFKDLRVEDKSNFIGS